MADYLLSKAGSTVGLTSCLANGVSSVVLVKWCFIGSGARVFGLPWCSKVVGLLWCFRVVVGLGV